MEVLVMTMTHNEKYTLHRWLDYYGHAVGRDHLLVLDDMSDDGSTDHIDATVLRLPRRATSEHFASRRTLIANRMAAGLLGYYDAVIYVDVDEFIVPDPRRYPSLPAMIEVIGAPVIAPMALNLLHRPALEGALQPDAPLLRQRRHVKPMPVMSKPAIKTKALRWTPGTHGIHTEFTVRNDAFLVHAKYADHDQALAVQALRHSENTRTGAGGQGTWVMTPDELSVKLAVWAEGDHEVPELDPASVDTTGWVSRLPSGAYRARGQQAALMDTQPLLRLPDYLSDQV